MIPIKTLEQARAERGITKTAVAKAAGICYPTYLKYEKDPRLMTVGQFAKVCEFIGCRPEDIFLASDIN